MFEGCDSLLSVKDYKNNNQLYNIEYESNSISENYQSISDISDANNVNTINKNVQINFPLSLTNMENMFCEYNSFYYYLICLIGILIKLKICKIFFMDVKH